MTTPPPAILIVYYHIMRHIRYDYTMMSRLDIYVFVNKRLHT